MKRTLQPGKIVKSQAPQVEPAAEAKPEAKPEANTKPAAVGVNFLDEIYSDQKLILSLQTKIAGLVEQIETTKTQLSEAMTKQARFLRSLPAAVIAAHEGRSVEDVQQEIDGAVMDGARSRHPEAVIYRGVTIRGEGSIIGTAIESGEPDELIKIAIPPPIVVTESEPAGGPVVAKPAADTAIVSSTEPHPEGWNEIPTQSILADVRGLGPNRIDFIVEKFPKLSDLHNSRVLAESQSRFWYNEFPKGTGKNIVARIAELMDQLKAKQDEPEAETADVLIDESAAESPKADSPHVRRVKSVYKSVMSDPSFESLSGGESDLPWVAGWDAAIDGYDYTQCPEELGIAEVTAWIKGWACWYEHEKPKLESVEAAEQGKVTAEVTDEVTAEVTKLLFEPVAEADPDQDLIEHRAFIVRTMGWLRENQGEIGKRSANDPAWWDRGYAAFAKNESFYTCPDAELPGYDFEIDEIDQIDWIRGWVAGQIDQIDWIRGRVAGQMEQAAKVDEVTDEVTTEVTTEVTDESPILSFDQKKATAYSQASSDLSPRRPKVSKKAYTDGYSAALRGIESPDPAQYEDSESIPQLADWYRGWLDGRELDADL
jgi:hypothetical protein